MNKLILASTSPYRRELFQRLGLSFECASPNVDEEIVKKLNLSPQAKAEKLALLKAQAVALSNPHAVVIAGDQIAHVGTDILDKPGTIQNAVNQILKLQGKTHSLLSAVCIKQGEKEILFTDKTQLTMRTLSEEQAIRYIENDSPLDCAGSYKLEEMGIALFSNIDSKDFTAIVGLPLIKLSEVLRNDFNFQIP